MGNYKGIALDILANFLNEANKSTYANKAAERVSSTRLGSKDYNFEKGNLIYHDTYFGSRDFIGEEIVCQDQNPIWGMNYYGFILDDDLSEEDVYVFLRKSLMQEYRDIIPVRGPKEFSEANWAYGLSIEGDLARFTGEEIISRDGKIVYRLFLHGGFIR